jgi:tRNA-Thr(GGU) m(6)t(6)A37 methyltransferase TsaA
MTSDIRLQPIGVIRSPFTEASGTPIQPRTAEGVEATAVLEERFADGLWRLEGFDRVWLVVWLDRAAAYRLRVRPYLADIECGVFATRAPSRPNPIGLSCVRLVRIEGTTLHLAEVDLLDGTPLLDIKPYAPRFDSYPDVRSGWLDDVQLGDQTADGRFENRG